MIDIETLSTENDAAIIAIGAVEFDLDEILQQQMWLIAPDMASGRRDNSTLTWWNNQWKEDPVMAQKVWNGTARESDVAAELFNWMVPFREAGHWIWAGPNTFDLAILKTWYKAQNMILPWNWSAGRDLSTLSRIADELGIDYSGEAFEGFQAHNPVSDCIKQARRCQIILKALNGRNQVYESERQAYSNRPGL